MKVRIERVNSELQRQITKIICEDIKDPRLSSGLVGVTRVQTTPDLKYAKVFLSVYADNEEDRTSVFDTVVRSKNFIRNMLKNAVQIRLLPDLTFILDMSCDYGHKIDTILANMDIPKADTDNRE